MNRASPLLLVALAVSTATNAGAEVVVIQSNVPGIDVGARFPDGWSPPTLRQGEEVRIMLPSLETRTFPNPSTTARGTGGTGGARDGAGAEGIFRSPSAGGTRPTQK